MSSHKDIDKGLIITVSGLHGSGRSTQAKNLANMFNLRYISTGTVFREMAEERGASLENMSKIAESSDEFDRYLDERAKEESRKGNVVIDATLSVYFVENPDISIFLWAPFKERVRRIAGRENRDIEEVRKETRFREESERERFLRYYDVDINDLSVYDVVLNTALYDAEGVARILKKIVNEYRISM